MTPLKTFYVQTLQRIEADVLSSVMAYVTICKEPHAFESLVESIKEKMNTDVTLQSAVEVSNSKDSKKN